MGTSYLMICPDEKQFVELGKINQMKLHQAEVLSFAWAFATRPVIFLSDQQFIDWWNEHYPGQFTLPNIPEYQGDWRRFEP